MAIMREKNPTTPGIYIEEVPSGARPIQAVGTRTAGFVGAAPKPDAHLNKAIAINNWTEFIEEFFPATNRETFWTNLAYGVYGFFLNGGSRCFVVNIGGTDQNPNPLINENDVVGLDVLARIDEVAMVAAPGRNGNNDYSALISHCEKLGDRVAIMDGPKTLTKDAIKSLGGEDPDPAESKKSEPAGAWKKPGKAETGQATLYVPWVVVANPNRSEGQAKTIPVPPSGHVAGVWSRSDALRGVHKAPANETVHGVLDVQYPISHSDQGPMNMKGVNCIRFFPNEGFLVWGARTYFKNAAWKYLNVRRLFNMIEESIAESTRWIVFEPNNRDLWNAIRRDVNAFLMGFWRDGALMGSTPEEAFYVKCDEENNPQSSINDGRVVIEIGIAPVKPAEFVMFKISQYEAGTEIEVGGK